MRRFLFRAAVLASIYLLVVLRWGYEYGRNDQMQTLAYARMLAEPSLYPHDNYLRGIHEHVPNERYIFSLLLSPFAGNLSAASLAGHALFAFLLFFLLNRIASLFLRVEPLRWLVPLLLFIPLYGLNLGGNELYYNSFFVSNVVKVTGMAGIWWMLTNRVVAAYGAFALATLLQPVVGLQLFVTSSCALVAGRVLDWTETDPKALAGGILGWLFTAGAWVLMLRSRFEAGPAPEPDRFFEILYEFRSPHHYLPSSWPLRNWILMSTLLGGGLIYYARRHAILFLFFVFGLLGCLAWLVGVELLRLVPVGAVQWFKITIWLEAFAVIAILAWLQPLFSWLERPVWKRAARIALLAAGAFALVVLSGFRDRVPMEVPFDYGDQMERDPAVDIAVEARALTPVDALFVHPISFTELKVYGRRSCWVDYKVLVHTRTAMHTWQARIRFLYGVAWDAGSPAETRYADGNAHFRALGPEDFERLRDEGVTHLLTFADVRPEGLREVVRNRAYAIWEL